MESLLFHALRSSEEVCMVKKQSFSGYENKPWLGEYDNYWNKCKGNCNISWKKSCSVSFHPHNIIVARLGLTSLYSPLILKVFLKCLLAYFPYLYLLGINSSSSPTSDRCIAFLHPYQIIMIIFARWIKKVSRRISQSIRLIHVKANRFCEQECQFL